MPFTSAAGEHFGDGREAFRMARSEEGNGVWRCRGEEDFLLVFCAEGAGGTADEDAGPGWKILAESSDDGCGRGDADVVLEIACGDGVGGAEGLQSLGIGFALGEDGGKGPQQRTPEAAEAMVAGP